METLDKFRAGEFKLLAASDVAARGLDIPDVSHVFNFDLPWQPDDYVHRIGRTGRAGKEGISTSLVTLDELKSLKDIEKMLGEPGAWIGEAPSEADYEEGSRKRRGGRGGRPAAGRPGRDGTPASRPPRADASRNDRGATRRHGSEPAVALAPIESKTLPMVLPPLRRSHPGSRHLASVKTGVRVSRAIAWGKSSRNSKNRNGRRARSEGQTANMRAQPSSSKTASRSVVTVNVPSG